MAKINDVLNRLDEINRWQVVSFNKINDLYTLEKYNHIKKNLPEEQGGEDYIDVIYKDITTHFFVPMYHIDYVQKTIVQTECFWEKELLEYFTELIEIYKGNCEGKIFVDAGSNIGNHTLFFSKILKASKVYCFEPQKEVFKILQKNISLNKVNAEIYNNVLSGS